MAAKRAGAHAWEVEKMKARGGAPTLPAPRKAGVLFGQPTTDERRLNLRAWRFDHAFNGRRLARRPYRTKVWGECIWAGRGETLGARCEGCPDPSEKHLILRTD